MVYQPYYEKPEHFIAASVLLPLLDTIVVALRFYGRRRQSLSLQADDWCTLVALVIALSFNLAVAILK